MKKLLLLLSFFPSAVFADRLGSLRSSADVLLTTQAASGSGSSVYPATATASFPFGYSASTATVGNATSTTFGNASYATINSSGSSQNLTININGQPSGGVQNKVGGVTINALGPGGPPIDMLVLYSSYTSAQGGSAMLSLWQDNPLRNDPMIWLHRVNFDSSPEMRWDGPSPNMEMVMNSGLNNAIGEGKWEPFAIANGSRHMQCGNNRANDNSTFENLCELYPLYSATEMPGVYYHAQSLANDSGILSSSDTASANFFSLNAHTVGITGPQNPSASYTFGLPDTVGAAGEFWYNSGNRGGNFNVRQLKHSGLDMVYGPTTGLTVSTITATTELIAAPIGNGTIAGPLNLQNPNIGAGNFYVGTNYYDNGASLTSPWFFGLHYGLSPTGWLFTDNAGAAMARVNNTLSSSQFVKTDTTQGLISYDLLAGSQTYSGENIFTSSAGIHSTTITSQCAQWDAAGNLNGSGSACGSGGGGGGTTTQYASQLVDCQVVRTSASSLGIASSATVTNPCTISFGSQVYQFTSSSTLTLGSSTGTVRVYVSNSADGTGAGTLQAAWSSATGLTGSGINVQTTDSVFGGGVPLGLWNATVAGTWDATGTDNRAWLNSTKPLLGGSGMTVTETATSQTVSFNGQVVVPNTSAYGLIISSSANLSNPFLAVSTNGVTTLNGATQISSGSYLIAVSSSILAGSTTGFALDTFFNLTTSGTVALGAASLPSTQFSVLGSTQNIFLMKTSTTNVGGFGVDISTVGHFNVYNSSASFGPTITNGFGDASCSDIACTVTASGSPVTFTFTKPYTKVPVCTITEQTDSIVNALSYSKTASAITITQTGLSGNLVDIICVGRD